MKKTLIVLLWLLMPLSLIAQPRVVAHRGHWRPDASQNSLASLQRAAEIGCYGSELDVWVTRDGVPVVWHDATMDGMRVENATYAEIMNHQLPNGEFLPTLQQYLSLGKQLPQCQLIVELKPHSTPERDSLVVRQTLRLVHLLGLERQVEYISFSLRACQYLHQLEPQAMVAYLSGDRTPAEVKAMGLTGIDYQDRVLRAHPEWLQEAEELGVEVNVWTVDGEEALRHHMALPQVDIITTNDPDLLLRLEGK